MRDLYNVSLAELLPPSLAADETVRNAALSIDTQLLTVTNQIRSMAFFSSLDTLSESLIDELAVELHVDFYDKSLPLDQKREIVKNSDAWHRRKGTASAVEELIVSIFGDGEVQEWFDYGGDPYLFQVVTSNESATQEKAVQFLAAVNSVKNARSWLDKVVINTADSMNLYVGGVLHMGEYMTVYQVV